MKFIAILMIALALGASTARADDPKDGDKKDDEIAKALSQIAQLGPGIHAVKKKGEKGPIKSCIIVGQARISTVLGKAKGLETARTQARLAAAAEFRKWIKEKISVYEKTETETITMIEGTEGGNKDTLKEYGKAVEKTSTRYESIAEGFVSGLQVLHFEVSGDDKTYTLVLGWDADTAKAAGKIDDPKKEGDTRPEDPNKPGDVKKPGDKKIEDKKVTSGEAKKFLP